MKKYIGCLLNHSEEIVFTYEDPSFASVGQYLNKIAEHPHNAGKIKSQEIGPKENYFLDQNKEFLWKQVTTERTGQYGPKGYEVIIGRYLK